MASPSPPSRPRAGLGRVLDRLGTTLLDVAAGDPHGPAAAHGVGGVVIHDPCDEPVLPPGALVLAVGVDDAAEIAALLRRVADQGGAGVVVRAPVPVDDRLTALAADTGTVLLGLTRGASWNQLAALLRALLGEGDVGADAAGAEPESLGGVPAGDLFALANAVSALLDAPITIEDRSSHLLAFSGRQDEADESRIETILGRQVPDRYMRRLEECGAFRRLYAQDGPVFVSPDDLGMPEVSLGRAAVAVRAGDEILGSIWAAVPGALSPARAQSLVDAAKLVALHLLRMRAGADVERRLVADLVATALEGGPDAGNALARLGLADRPLVVLALGLPEGDGEPETLALARRETERQRAADALAVHLSALHPDAVVAALRGVAYGIVPVPRDEAGAGEERVVAIAAGFLQRTSARSPGFIGVGRLATDITTLTRARDDADRALRVLRSAGSSGTPSRRVARAADVQVESLLLRLADLDAAEGHEPAGPVGELLAYDAAHRTHLVKTLRAWLDAFGDVNVASSAVHVHPNTFRYRLRRIVEVGHIDLDDADTRFAAMLQLRLLGHTGDAAR
ncbi:PucR family transcriptional regulator [Pseudonocardia kunmingensis]|uniref:DNA-binding PucR family transcriptional regulator n=1 Tax=Pseudonocardia kunmingensis TaxID=630975 RepID=A0A543DRR3_9PSEU|nr:PucR family transcriptional regulator [Pseudonocardia kunmingensis]TQM12030.1 DNA-binding PucR family transcriptional regulator [Pseudonocardia kunmingensis]